MTKIYGPKHGKIVNAGYKEEYTNDQRSLYRFIDFISGGVVVQSITIANPTGLTPNNGDAYYVPNLGEFDYGIWTPNTIQVWRTDRTTGTTNTPILNSYEVYQIPERTIITDHSTGYVWQYRMGSLALLYGVPVLDIETYGDFNSTNWASLSSGTYTGDFLIADTTNIFWGFSEATRIRFSVVVINSPEIHQVTITARPDNNYSNCLVFMRAAWNFSCAVSSSWKLFLFD